MAESGPHQNIAGAAFPVVAREPPPEGQKVGSLSLALTPINFSLSAFYDLSQAAMSQVRTLFVDNSRNNQALSVTHGVNNQTTVIPSGGGAFIPTTSNGSNYFYSISTANAPPGNIGVTLAFYNYAIPPSIWGTEVITVQSSVPSGSIILWYGSAATIPPGFGLCDGSTYARTDGSGNIISPNLVNKFVLGANTGTVGNIGGSFSITQANLPSVNWPVTDTGHFHTITDPTHEHAYYADITPGGSSVPHVYGPGVSDYLSYNTSFAYTGITINNNVTGISVSSGGAGANYAPPYLALLYIMKL